MKPQNFEERLVWCTIIGTYGFYFIGAQPLFVPIMAWLLTLYLCKKLWEQNKNTPPNKKITISLTAWVWIIFMFIILLAIVVAHINFYTGDVRLIKSLLKWTREHAVWALLPLIGCLNIRPQLLYRAACIVCLQSLIYIPICYLAFILDLPGVLYTSPLSRIGGNSPDLYRVALYVLDYKSNIPRLTLFSPWCPNLALIAIIYFFLARQESDKKWRLIGMIGAIAMVVTSLSRAGILWFPTIMLLTWILTNLTRPVIYFTASVGSFLTSIFIPRLFDLFETFTHQLHSARASSSNTRMIALELAIDRWWNEAPIWGHGFTEATGPAIMYFLPIGTSGNTWTNLLYTKGLVGFTAFAVPLLWSFINLLNKAQKSEVARVGLSIFLVFFFFSFTEEIDNLAYLYWPGLLMMGIAFKKEVWASASTVINVSLPLLKG